MNSFTLEASLHWAALICYVVGLILAAHSVVFGHERRVWWARLAIALALLPHSGALLLRWIEVGHGPYMMKYEVLSSNSWIAVVMLQIFLWRRPRWSAISLVAMPGVIVMMGFALFADPRAHDLPPILRTGWLALHVVFNKLAVGGFLLSLAAAVLLLRKLKGGQSKFLERWPDVDVLEAYSVRFTGFGFIFWTVAVVSGALWAQQSWGRYWGWDPIETWSLITWLAYGTLLHARLFFKLRPQVTAWATVGCFGLSILTLFILPFTIPSLHTAYFQ